MTSLRKLFAGSVTLAGALGFAASTAAAGCKLSIMAVLPVNMVGTKPTVVTQINGIDATFMVDDGAFYSIITPGSAAQFGLHLTPAPYGLTVRGIGGTTSMQVATVKKFGVVGQVLPNVQFLVGGSELGDDHGRGIGENILGLADNEYDLAKGAVRLIRADGCARANFPYWVKTEPSSEIDIDVSQRGSAQRGIGSAELNGTRLRVQFDTGASASLITRSAAKRAGIDVNGPGAVRGGLSSGFGKHTIQTWIVPVDVFKIGGEEIHKTKLRVIERLFDSNDAPDMLIGADFFLSHHIYVAKSLHKLYFTYNGGAVFNLKTIPGELPAPVTTVIDLAPAIPGLSTGNSPGAAPAAAAEERVTAEALARRGTAYAGRRDYGHAVADLGEAIALAPDEPRYRLERARIYFAGERPLLASADLDQTLRLSPANLDALTMHAGFRLAQHDRTGALTDLDAADKAAPHAADLRVGMAQMYEHAEALPQALMQFNLWIKAHRDDVKQAAALDDRCWVRALIGEQLDLALKDCNAALRLSPKNPGVLDSRSLVLLRQGAFAKAVADYDAALAQRPSLAWSHEGRGIAKLRQGAASDGNADIAPAKTLDSDVERFAKEHGVTP